MKKFFEEYGFVILVAIVVIILIAMVSPIGGLIKTQISDIATSFGKKTDIKLRAASDGNNTANLRYDSDGKIQLDFSSKNSTDTFTAYANYISEGKEIEDEPLTNIVNHPAGTAAISLASVADIGKYLQIKLINDGTQEIFYSNGLVIKNNNTADNKDNKDDENKQNLISKTEHYIGSYADIDGNGTVDGVIFADLAFSKSGTWNNNSWSSWSYTAQTGLKDYYVSQESYTGSFGTAAVISPVSGTTGNDRFYVMALSDIDGKQNGTYYGWYNDAYGNATKILSTVSTLTNDFGSGKSNTNTVMSAWNNGTYAQDTHSKYKDIWGQIQTQVNNGWFVPSKSEWAAFGKAFNITSSNFSSHYGLSHSYWSSSLYSASRAYSASFVSGYIYNLNVNNYYYVRLAVTF